MKAALAHASALLVPFPPISLGLAPLPSPRAALSSAIRSSICSSVKFTTEGSCSNLKCCGISAAIVLHEFRRLLSRHVLECGLAMCFPRSIGLLDKILGQLIARAPLSHHAPRCARLAARGARAAA